MIKIPTERNSEQIVVKNLVCESAVKLIVHKTFNNREIVADSVADAI